MRRVSGSLLFLTLPVFCPSAAATTTLATVLLQAVPSGRTGHDLGSAATDLQLGKFTIADPAPVVVVFEAAQEGGVCDEGGILFSHFDAKNKGARGDRTLTWTITNIAGSRGVVPLYSTGAVRLRPRERRRTVFALANLGFESDAEATFQLELAFPEGDRRWFLFHAALGGPCDEDDEPNVPEPNDPNEFWEPNEPDPNMPEQRPRQGNGSKLR